MKKIAFLLLFLLTGYSITSSQERDNSSVAINCEECCKQGRFVTRECCINCNGCTMYNDGATAECNDYPM